MPTITKTIGTTGRDYTTVQAWEDALPANLITDGNAQLGNCFNDSEFTVAGTVVTFSGSTCDATHDITLATGSGQSFRDNANIQTNALRYNQANGVGLRKTNTYNDVIVVSEDFVTLRGLQIAHTGGGSSDQAYKIAATSRDNCLIDDCILEASSPGAFNGVVFLRSGRIRNSLVVNRNSGAGNGITFDYVGTVVCVGNTIVRPSDLTASGNGLLALGGGTAPVTNCAIFGFTNSVNDTARFSGSNNASDKTIGFGTSNQASKTYANQFVTITDAARDFRAKSGGDIINTGVTDTTNGTPDIAGTARPSGASYDIGCWELVSGAAAVVHSLTLLGVGV